MHKNAHVESRIEQQKLGRAKLLLLAAVFLAPVVAAYSLYGLGWQSDVKVNYGKLVQPAQPLSDLGLRSLEDRPFRFEELQGKWTMVYFGAAECLKSCEAALYRMRQVHLAQGRQADRVQRVFIMPNNAARDISGHLLLDYPGTQVLMGEPDAVGAMVRRFPLVQNHTYLVDPLGNLIMSYPPDADFNGIRKDLSRLLRTSQIG